MPLRTDIDLALRTRDTARARQLLELAQGLAPQDAQLMHLKGMLQQGSGDAEGALRTYARALELDPRQMDVLVARGALLTDLKRWDDALADLNRAASMSQWEPRVAYLKSLALAAKGDTPGSQAQLEVVTRLIDELPEDFLARQPPLLMLGGLACQGLGRMEKARVLMELYVQRVPNDPAGRKLLANLYLTGADPGRVADVLEPLMRSGDTDPQIYTTVAALRMQQRRYREAAEALEAAAKAGGGQAGVVAQMGFARIANQQPDVGLAHLRRSFDKEPAQLNVAAALSTLYLRRGDGRSALHVVEALTRSTPTDPLAHNLMGAVQSALHKPADARKAYQKALELQPALVPAALNLARLEMADGKPELARERLEAVLKRDGRQVQALTELARVEILSQRLAAALSLLERARTLAPRDVACNLELITLHQRMNNPGAALRVARALAEQRPQDAAVQEALARAYLQTGDNTSARSTLAALARLLPNDADRIAGLGRLQLQAGAGREAAVSAERALALRANHTGAAALQVEAELLLGETARAEALLKTLAQRTGNAQEAARLTGDMAFGRRQYADAWRAYATAYEKQPSAQLAQRAYQSAFHMNEPEKAVQIMEHWLRLSPNDLQGREMLAEAYLRLNRLPQARAAYENLLGRQPGLAAATNNLAVILMRQNDPGALALAEKAVSLAPADAGALDTLGWLRARAGAFDAALKLLRDARLRDPGSRDIRYHLAWTLHRSGRKDEAKAELVAALGSTGVFESETDARSLARELGV
jgi:putative PEP-CTERM system TPR-repeat lipoprotein